MNKRKFRHRLLSVVLAMLMVVGMIPVSEPVTVKAADDQVIYLDLSGLPDTNREGWTKPGVHAMKDDGTILNSNFSMTEISDTLYSANISSDATKVIFTPQTTWDKGETDTVIIADAGANPPTTYPMFRVTNYTNEKVGWHGEWSTYSSGNSSTTSGTFYVDADLVDYYNDARVDNAQYGILEKNNQGDVMGDAGENKGVAFSYLNQKISDAYGTISGNIPLYFGSLLFVNNRVGRASVGAPGYVSLKSWNSTANVALTVKGQNDNNVSTASHNTDASVRGLVYDELGENGELLALDGKTELPYFSETIAKNWTVTDESGNNGKSLMKYYADYKFPFKVTTYENSNVKKYSYDSETDYAVYVSENTSDKKLKTSNSHTKNVTTDSDGNEINGYFPFNTPGETERKNVNYGFGTKFTIPFTVNKNGTIDGTTDGEAITFNFTGDDDVWVFLDGKLVLDMGGAHGKATGSIDFKNLEVTIEDSCEVSANETISGDSNVTSSYSGFTNWLWDVGCPSDNNTTNAYAQERSAVETGEYTATFESLHGKDFADTFKDSDKTHTLVMFYMERGMFDSNMKIEFTINPLPSGLSLSKTLDTTDVNAGLKDAVQLVDTNDFNFEIQTKDLTDAESAYGPVSDLHYSLNNYENKDTSTEATYEYNEEDDTLTKTLITGIGTRSFAHTFVNGSGSDRFVGGTGFHITEQTNTNTILKYDYTKTQWTVYDKKNNYSIIAQTNNKTNTENESCTNPLVAAFYMGSSESTEFDTYDYYVNFKNTPIVSDLALEKEWIGNTTSPESFTFTVLLDLNGGTDYKPYKLAFTSSNTERTDLETTEDGVVTVAPGEKITFNGIPVNATYKIVETAPEKTGSWKLSGITLGTGTSATTDTDNYAVTGKILEEKTGVKNAVKFINTDDSLSVSKVIYVEAGQPTTYAGSGVDKTSFAVTNMSDGITVTTKGKDADDNEITVEPIFTASEANKTYTVDYKGSKDGVNYTGTITVYTFSATNKVYVFDYGLKSDLAATNDNGDGLFQGGVFHNDAAEATTGYKTTATLGDIIATTKENTETTIANDAKGSLIKKIDSKYSLVDADNNHKEVWFTPVAFMTSAEAYTYTANITKTGITLDTANPETGTVVNGTIKVMPASTVYYEDNFNADSSDDSSVKIIYSNSGISTDGTAPTVALEQSNDQSEQYGYDSEYADDTEYSGGTATKMSQNATATFTFKGTGFDILSRVNKETATIGVKVYSVEDETETLVKNIPLITYYDNGDLYQVPVIHENDFEYGTYKVVIEVKSYNPDDVVFYLDGIRIYNPLGENTDDYLASESMATDQEIRPLILASTVSGGTDTAILCKYTTGTDGNVLLSKGGTYVEVLDGASPEDADAATGDLNQYWKWGPNNELYLEAGNAVAFLIDKDTYDSYEEYGTLQVAAKLENGISASLSAITAEGNAVPVQTVTDGEVADVTAISTATTMYYHVPVSDAMVIEDTDGTEYYQIILANTSSSADSRLSITNIKCCVDPDSFMVPDYAASPAARSSIAESMYKAFTTEDENVRSATFSGKVLKGKVATLSVTTSTGVDSLCIVDQDGNTVTPSSIKSVTKTMNNGDVVYVWTVKFTAPETAGSYTYHISGITGAKETITIGEPVLTVK